MSDVSFKSIGEVAKELGLEHHVLRFWETKFSQIRPLKRAGGRRYYRTDDVALLHRIKHLLYTEGYRINGVQKMLKQQGIKAFLNLSESVDTVEESEKNHSNQYLPKNDETFQKTVLPSDQMSFMVGSDSAEPSTDDIRVELQNILQDLKSIQKLLAK